MTSQFPHLHHMPTRPCTVSQYVDSLKRRRKWQRISSAETFGTWLGIIFTHARDCATFLGHPDPDVLDAIDAVGHQLSETFALPQRGVHLDYLDALTAAGIAWEFLPTKWSEEESALNFTSWVDTGTRDLGALCGKESIHDTLFSSLYAQPAEQLELILTRLLKVPATCAFVARWLGWVAGRRRQAKGSVSRWAKLQPVRRVLADPRFAALNPAAHREIVQVDVAEEVCARLRLGSLREYTWPAFEETVAGKTFDPTLVCCDFPTVAVSDGHTVTLLVGDERRSATIPAHTQLKHAVDTGCDTYVEYCDTRGTWHYLWLSEGIPRAFDTPAPLMEREFSDAQKIGDTWYLGSTPLAPRLTQQPYGELFGLDPTFFFTPDHTTPHPMLSPVTCVNTGETLSRDEFDAYVWETLLGKTPHSRPVQWFNFSSTLTRATPNTCDSPLGDENGTHYCIMFGGNADEDTTLFSPLGQFSGPFGLCAAMKRPGGGTWIVGNELFDAATNLPITPAPTPLNAAHPLEWLPLQALHYLRVHNLDVSRKMRDCTVSDATRLLAEPEAVREFTCGDVVLADMVNEIIANVQALTLPPATKEPPQ